MNKYKISLITIMALSCNLMGVGSLGALEEKDIKIQTIQVEEEAQSIKEKKVSEIRKTAKDIIKQQVQDTRDLVKYETGVSVVETGRMGTSGYSIRGVDENRVAITIDGLGQAQTLSSQGFKEIFEGYGNFNNTRNGIEVENIKQVNITKGADSIKSGSGALGGSVMFETKDTRDYLIDKDYYYGFKRGYSSADTQNWQSHTLAGRFGFFDLLAVRTKREGNELKNYGYNTYDDSVRGREREKADPYRIKKDGTLVKFGFMPHEEHRFSFINDEYKSKSEGHDYSYTLYPRSASSWGQSQQPKVGERYTNDLSERSNRSFVYENFSQTLFWDSLKITYSDQKIIQRARTQEYCRGNKCIEISNPLNLKTKNGGIVDKDSKEILAGRGSNGLTYLVDGEGNKHSSGFLAKDINEYALDCTIFDCNGKLNLYKFNNNNNTNAEQVDLDLKNKTQNFTSSDGKTYTFDVSDDEYNGKKYKVIKAQNEFTNWLGDKVKANTRDFLVLLPGSRGFLERLWRERDLNTHTKQLNFDFEKEFEVLKTEHYLKYGVIYSKTLKEMVNKSGFDATQKQWWANTYKPDCKGYDASNALKCPKVSAKTSFLIPVKSKSRTLYLSDSINFNDFIGLDFGYRYDKIKYNPNYIPGVTPAIPQDMIRGLFVPLATNPLSRPNSLSDFGYDRNKFNEALEKYNKKQAEVDAKNANNFNENVKYLLRPKEYKNSSYSFGVNLDPLEFLRVQTKYSKGFRAPTTDELYFTFKHPDFTIKPNVNLLPEIAKTKEIAFTFHNNLSFLTLGRFETNYSNFLDLKFIGTQRVNISSQSALDFDMYQNVNRQRAKVSGFEINSKINLGDIVEAFSGFYFGYKLTKQKGRILTDDDGAVPMNAIQPKTSVYNIGYSDKNNKFGLDIYITKVSAKKPQDTYNMFWKNERGDTINGKSVDDYRSHWLSDKYTTIDTVVFIEPIKSLVLRFGAYNITDKKYLTWENARSVRSFGTMNMVRKKDGLGINRFYSPGRNFKLTFEYSF